MILKAGHQAQEIQLQLYTKKLAEKQDIGNIKTLHERMIYSVEDFIQHNWSDVAIHDKKRIDAAGPGEAYAWIVSKFGSYLTPLFSRLSEKDDSDEEVFAPIQVLFFRWLKQQPFEENKIYCQGYAPEYSKCFIVVKGGNDYTGAVHPVGYRELMDFVLLNLPQKYLNH